ncbi:MAG: DUF3445 domain-containing protein [Pseudomonadota bacterium]
MSETSAAHRTSVAVSVKETPGPQAPRFAPYAGRQRPFSIAMAPIDHADWLDIDDNRAAELALKRAIFGEEPAAFTEAEGTREAQAEAFGMLADYLGERGIVLPDAAAGPPLLAAALGVQDDLVLMRRGEDAWHLAAAALAFPSAWRLEEMFGLPMDDIHKDVPGWEGPMAARVKRIFDSLAPDALVGRLNWSVQAGEGLRQAHSKHYPPRKSPPGAPLFLRVERQTLRKLPVSGDLLFTIKVMLDPIEVLGERADGPTLAAMINEVIAGLDDGQLAYKNLTETKNAVMVRIEQAANCSRGAPAPAETLAGRP